MTDNLQIVDGRQVTVTEVNPPEGWTNDYAEMGGDMEWGPEGDVPSIASNYGVEGVVKPLFAMQSWTGEAMSLFEAGSGEFYLYNAIEGSLFQIIKPTDLQSIASTIDDPDKGGLGGLEIEQR